MTQGDGKQHIALHSVRFQRPQRPGGALCPPALFRTAIVRFSVTSATWALGLADVGLSARSPWRPSARLTLAWIIFVEFMSNHDQRLEEIDQRGDHAILASRDRGMPVVPDELVPWFQGIMVRNQPWTPRSLETMGRSLSPATWCS